MIWQVALWGVFSTTPQETVLLDFYADWCGPCRAMVPIIEQLARQGYPIRKINIDHHPEVAARFGVRAVPCFVMVVNGREVARDVGLVSLARLEQLCRLGQKNSSSSSACCRGRRGGSAGAERGQNPGPTSLASSAPGPTGFPRPPESHQLLPGPQPPILKPSAANSSAGNEASAPPGGANALSLALGADLPTNKTPSGQPLASGFSKRCLSGKGVTEEELVAATVRLRVYEGSSLSHGTGTIIDARQGEALILTCGHLFRESRGQGRIEVDLFGPTPAQKLPGRLIAWNDQRDLGLVSIRTPGPVRTARVAPVGYPLQKGLVVFSVGCDHGQSPTVHKTWIVSINRYLGPPNLQVADQPASGRSGGGLFSQEGYLIGVCNAADPADREGLFASLPAIHAQLDEAQLQFVYQQVPDLPPEMPRPDGSPSTALNPSSLVQLHPPSSLAGEHGGSLPRMGSQEEGAGLAKVASPQGPLMELVALLGKGSPGGTSSSRATARSNPAQSAPQEIPTSGPLMASRPQGPSAELLPLAEERMQGRKHSPATPEASGRLLPEESALLAELARRHQQGAEIIFIVRPKSDPQAETEIFVLRHASPELLARLATVAEKSQIRETSLVFPTNQKGTDSIKGAHSPPGNSLAAPTSSGSPFSLAPQIASGR